MIFQFGQFKLDIDVDKTREFYKEMEYVSEGCSCAGCRNFEKAVNVLPREVVEFFESLGIDMKKITEVYVYTTNPNGTVYYGGFFHLCGRLLEGNSAWEKESVEMENAGLFQWKRSNTYPLSKDFCISFKQGGNLVEKEFPEPVLTIDIEANIPWVLDEENTYS